MAAAAARPSWPPPAATLAAAAILAVRRQAAPRPASASAAAVGVAAGAAAAGATVAACPATLIPCGRPSRRLRVACGAPAGGAAPRLGRPPGAAGGGAAPCGSGVWGTAKNPRAPFPSCPAAASGGRVFPTDAPLPILRVPHGRPPTHPSAVLVELAIPPPLPSLYTVAERAHVVDRYQTPLGRVGSHGIQPSHTSTVGGLITFYGSTTPLPVINPPPGPLSVSTRTPLGASRTRFGWNGNLSCSGKRPAAAAADGTRRPFRRRYTTMRRAPRRRRVGG